ncbi:MAG TPA: ABC transporter ATP-binding protein [Jiangellaceae bacterium]|nr:ABC transporter ATP-binding protein [Jiangellaceae bacterium]
MAAIDPENFDERDFDEVDHEPDESENGEPDGPLPAQRVGTPSVIVDDVHVKYRVFGGRKKSVATDTGKIRAFFNRSRRHVGAISEVHAVRGVSFVAHHGESIGIVGMNGAGKSTLLRAVAGLMPVSSGDVYVSGSSALLGVNAALIKSLTGERNIMIGGLALGLTKAEVQERYDEIVEFAGLQDFVHLPMKAYSSGMAARLRFAISTAAVPDILMIDEALATGDASFRARSQKRIEQIRERAGTVFLVSHSIRAVRNMCDRAIWLDQGKVVDDGPSDEVMDRYAAELRRRR